MIPLFTYGSLTDSGTYFAVVGRHPEAAPALLRKFRVEHRQGYAWLVEDPGSEVEGFLVTNVQPADYWILDDYQHTAEGLYERRTVQVLIGNESVEAAAYVAGSAMSDP